LKIKHLLPLLVSIVLILVMVATSCTPAAGPATTVTVTPPAVTVTATPTSAAAKDKTYRAVNPAGDFTPVQTKSLAPRLDTLDGKLIYVNQGEADPIIMPALYDRLKKDYPKTTWKMIATSSFGPSTPEAEVTANAKAVIRGIGW
jgi:hypothetical protein